MSRKIQLHHLFIYNQTIFLYFGSTSTFGRVWLLLNKNRLPFIFKRMSSIIKFSILYKAVHTRIFSSVKNNLFNYRVVHGIK